MSKQSEKDPVGILYLISKGGEEGFPFKYVFRYALLGKLEFGFPFSFKYESHYYGLYWSSCNLWFLIWRRLTSWMR